MGVLKTRTLFYVLMLLSALSLAAGFDKDDEEKPWAEIEAKLPDYPEQQDLIPFRVGMQDDSKYFIDSKSLSVGSDGVIRYTLVVLSAAGAKNISYEGMRCGIGELRYYAFGRADKTWSKARSDRWVKFHGTNNDHHVELYTKFFCPVGAPNVRDADAARRALRAGS